LYIIFAVNPGTPYEKKRFGPDDTVSEAEKKQMEQEVNALAKDVHKMNVEVKYSVKKLRLIADELDDVWKDCKIASALGNGAGIVGGLMTISGAIATTAIVVINPLVIAGAAFGVAGACANLGANYVESSANSSGIEEADRAVANANRAINDVRKRIRLLKEGKSVARLVFCANLAVKMLGPDHQAVALITGLLTRCDRLFKVLPESAVHLISQLARKLGEATTSAAEKVGTQIGAKKAGAFIAGVNAFFIIVDTVELSFTIRDIVKKKGSRAARWLRCKADELEEIHCT